MRDRTVLVRIVFAGRPEFTSCALNQAGAKQARGEVLSSLYIALLKECGGAVFVDCYKHYPPKGVREIRFVGYKNCTPIGVTIATRERAELARSCWKAERVKGRAESNQ